MVRQGFSITVIPEPNGSGEYRVIINSQGWENNRCVASRSVVNTILHANPSIVADGEFRLWLNSMTRRVARLLEETLAITEASRIREANRRPQDTTGDGSHRV